MWDMSKVGLWFFFFLKYSWVLFNFHSRSSAKNPSLTGACGTASVILCSSLYFSNLLQPCEHTGEGYFFCPRFAHLVCWVHISAPLTCLLVSGSLRPHWFQFIVCKWLHSISCCGSTSYYWWILGFLLLSSLSVSTRAFNSAQRGMPDSRMWHSWNMKAKHRLLYIGDLSAKLEFFSQDLPWTKHNHALLLVCKYQLSVD